ncbi:AgrD family cyclic lactone autoinducer peptide [Clostridium sp. WILCCON 0269]|uniref:AgrD family cyclic lactone autoinducer peptide n=1 Tax=Candidatus Clostridium eludens TaxID=3381663 RepID=A0ABW8SH38_9CLOT
MKLLKEKLLRKSMKMLGNVSLVLAAVVLVVTSSGGYYQPKCPEKLLK